MERALRGLVVVLATLLVIAGTGAAYTWWRYGNIGRVDTKLDESTSSEPQNFLIVGSDSREGISEDSPGSEALLEGHGADGRRSDTLILVRIDPDDQRVDMVSFPRDLWLTLSTGEEQRINVAYQHGPQAVIDTIQDNFNVPVNHYVEVNFLAFQRLVEAVGGVPIFINRAVRDKNSGLNLPVKGCVRLDGYQALAFSRSRHLEYQVGDTWRVDGSGDQGRITRQQVFIRQALARVSDLGLSDVLVFDRLAAAAGESVTLDKSLSIGDLLGLGKRFRNFNPDSIQSHVLTTTDYTTSGGAKVQLLDEESAEPIFDIFRGGSAPEPVPPRVVIPEEVAVEVLNATGQPGFASTIAERLAKYTFVIANTGNPPDGVHATSEIHYPPGAAASATLLSQYFIPVPVLVEDVLIPPGEVQVIVGTDHIQMESPKERADEAERLAKEEAEQLEEAGVSTTTTPPTTSVSAVTGPVALGVEVGDPPPGVKCD